VITRKSFLNIITQVFRISLQPEPFNILKKIHFASILFLLLFRSLSFPLHFLNIVLKKAVLLKIEEAEEEQQQRIVPRLIPIDKTKAQVTKPPSAISMITFLTAASLFSCRLCDFANRQWIKFTATALAPRQQPRTK
jgi:hypothetical protein